MWKFSEHGLWNIIWVAQTLKNGLFHQKSSNRNWSSGNCSYLVEKSMVRIQTARPQWPKALIRSSERSMTCPKERGWNLTEVRPATWERPEKFMNSENLWFARSNVLIKSARSRFCGLLTCPMLKCCWMWDFSHFHAISARPKPYRVATLAEDWYEDLQKKPRIMFAIVTMRQWNMAMENLPFIDDFPISISIVVGFPPLPCSIIYRDHHRMGHISLVFWSCRTADCQMKALSVRQRADLLIWIMQAAWQLFLWDVDIFVSSYPEKSTKS